MSSYQSSLALLIVLTGFFARAGEKTEPVPSPDSRPPGGNGDQFYRVFLSDNDPNGDRVVTKEEFRGSATRFDAMDKNSNGKLDRDEIGELHKSRHTIRQTNWWLRRKCHA